MDRERTDRLEERYLNVHEASQILEISEEELWNLVHEHKVPTHNIAGAFLRFRKDDVEELKIKWRIQRELFPKKSQYFVHQSAVLGGNILEKIRDFWYFNDFYFLCFTVVAVLLYFIISSQ